MLMMAFMSSVNDPCGNKHFQTIMWKNLVLVTPTTLHTFLSCHPYLLLPFVIAFFFTLILLKPIFFKFLNIRTNVTNSCYWGCKLSNCFQRTIITEAKASDIHIAIQIRLRPMIKLRSLQRSWRNRSKSSINDHVYISIHCDFGQGYEICAPPILSMHSL